MKRIISLMLVCIMLVGCVFALASCGGPNSDPAKAKAALEDAGYDAELVDDKISIGLMSLGVDGIKAVVMGSNKEDRADGINIFYFEDAEAAEKAFEPIKNKMEEASDDEEEKKYEIKQSGAMIWFGTKDAIKAAK